MLQENQEEPKNIEFLQKAVSLLEKRGYDFIKAPVKGYESPSKLVNSGEGQTYAPDITATRADTKDYIELSVKTDQIRQLVSKWKIIEKLAKMKNGAFILLVPKGNLSFTSDILKTYGITAAVQRF